MRDQIYHNLLGTLRAAMKLDRYDFNNIFHQYASQLAKTFDGLRRLAPIDPSILRNNNLYEDWESYNGSSMILLRGRTVAPDRTQFCWLSYLMAKAIHVLRESRTDVL